MASLEDLVNEIVEKAFKEFEGNQQEEKEEIEEIEEIETKEVEITTCGQCPFNAPRFSDYKGVSHSASSCTFGSVEGTPVNFTINRLKPPPIKCPLREKNYVLKIKDVETSENGFVYSIRPSVE